MASGGTTFDDERIFGEVRYTDPVERVPVVSAISLRICLAVHVLLGIVAWMETNPDAVFEALDAHIVERISVCPRRYIHICAAILARIRHESVVAGLVHVDR
jgi:hypothetical protein